MATSSLPAFVLWGNALHLLRFLAYATAAAIGFAMWCRRGVDGWSVYQDGPLPAPFSYRVLAPWIAEIFAGHSATNAYLYALNSGHWWARVLESQTPAPPSSVPFVAVLLIINYCALLGSLLLMHRFLSQCYPHQRVANNLAPLALVLVLPILSREGSRFPYDLVALFLSLVTHYFLFTNRLRLYYVALVFALLNKETAILAVISFFLFRSQTDSLLRAGGHAALQLLIFMGLRLLIADASGIGDEPILHLHLSQNLEGFWSSHFLYEEGNLALLFVVIAIVSRNFWDKALALRVWLIELIPLTCLYLIGGVWGEVRVFYDILPLFILLAVPEFSGTYHGERRPPPFGQQYVSAICLLGTTALCGASLYQRAHAVSERLNISPEVVSLEEVSAKVPPGHRWDAPPARPFKRSGITITLAQPRSASSILCSLDGNDAYQMRLMEAENIVAQVTIPAGNQAGMQERTVAVPPVAQTAKISAIEIVPLAGDESFSLGHIYLLPPKNH
jgi:hypothetical protein